MIFLIVKPSTLSFLVSLWARIFASLSCYTIPLTRDIRKVNIGEIIQMFASLAVSHNHCTEPYGFHGADLQWKISLEDVFSVKQIPILCE